MRWALLGPSFTGWGWAEVFAAGAIGCSARIFWIGTETKPDIGEFSLGLLGIDLRVTMMGPLQNHPTMRLPHPEPTHCRAICQEVGERLRLALDRRQSPLPSRLRRTLDRFEEID